MYNSSPHNKSQFHRQRLDVLPTLSYKAFNNNNVYICIYICIYGRICVCEFRTCAGFLNNKEHGMANYPT